MVISSHLKILLFSIVSSPSAAIPVALISVLLYMLNDSCKSFAFDVNADDRLLEV